jgi:hypothetical protein
MKKIPLLILLIFVIHLHGSSQPCLPEGIIFSTQEQIDNFQTNYSGCTEIEGEVWIGKYQTTDISNLDGLNPISKIGGGLGIRHNPNLVDLQGLNNLVDIGGFLTIDQNFTLENLMGLDKLTTIGETFNITNSHSLKSCNGLESLLTVGESVHISSNDSLKNIEGLNNLTTIGGDLYLTIHQMENIAGLRSLTSIGGAMTLMDNYQLIDLNGFSNLTGIGGKVFIYSNLALTSISGLQNIVQLDSGLTISQNFLLPNLDGLENLISLKGVLWIHYNLALSNIDGLKNLESGLIDHLYIAYNPLLANCETKSICEYLASPNGEIEIFDNAEGCNNQQEVEDACNAGIEVPNTDSPISIYPNPAKNELFVSARDGVKIRKINIYMQTGQVVLNQEFPTEAIDITTLQPGMYIIEVSSDEFKLREKLVVK